MPSHTSFPSPLQLLRAGLISLHHVLAFAPTSLLAVLYLFSWRAATFLAHWPEPDIDDPKFVAMEDWVSDMLYGLVAPLFVACVLSMVAFPVLTLVLRRAYPRWWTICLICLFVLGWVFQIHDPTDRLGWYFD